MLKNNIIFQFTQLAEASYADFFDIKNNAPVTDDQVITQRLGLKDIGKTQATDLISHWSIASHQKNTSSGFSATLFQSKDDSSQYVLAMRGTEQKILDLAIADGMDIVRDGLAMDQIVDMYNYWQQLIAPKGQLYEVAVLETDLAMSAMYNAAKIAGPAGTDYISSLRNNPHVVIDEPLGKVRRVAFKKSSEVYSDERFWGLGINPGSVTVVGHSLGGHLAAAFSRLFPSATNDVLMVNGAGFGDQGAAATGGNGPTNVSHLFSMLGGASSFDGSKITNLVGSAGWDFVSQDWWIGLNQPGGDIKQEIQAETIQGTAVGHGASQMTDGMVVYSLLFTLDATLASSTPKGAIDYLAPIFKSGSAKSEETFESLVNAVGSLLVPNYVPAAIGKREDLYSRIHQINDQLQTKNLTGKLTIQLSSASLDSTARSDFSAFLSLYNLSPIYLKANGISQDSLNATLCAANSDIYGKWQADNQLTAEQRAAGEANFSDLYLHDRAAMLAWVIRGNTNDTRRLSSDQSFDNWTFTDVATKESFIVGGIDTAIVTRQVYFGDNNANSFSGGRLNDYLYGGDGNDALSGGGGNDHLEGNIGNDTLKGDNGSDYLYGGAGDDKLYGGEGVDKLYGGKGNDTLIGGKGNDALYGGAGFDTYVYNIGDGTDTIIDCDKQGRIFVTRDADFIPANTLYRSGTSNIWTDACGKVRITHNSPWRIVLEDGGTIELGEDFQDGDFGIHLRESLSITSANTITGDLAPTNPSDPQYDHLGNVITDPNRPDPGRSDILYDSAANDLIRGEGGDDAIGSFKGGDDILEGGAGNDVILDNAGDNQLFGESYGEMTELVGAGETATGTNTKGDLVSGGSGSDCVYGSNRNDALFGGEGADLLSGGGGDDVIDGDRRVNAALLNWGMTVRNNPDAALGVAFDNLALVESIAGGADNIYGGSGNDFIYAGAGDDNVDGGIGNDIVYGEGGNDAIAGGGGNDILNGDADWLAAGSHGNDYIDGGDGDDIMLGLGGSDELFGGDGNDELQGGEGDDYLDGEAGDDLLFGDTGKDQLMGGDGLDEIYGGESDDYLDGGAGSDQLYGDDGNDELFGGDGNDHLQGHSGDDYLDGEQGDDKLMGGSGNDTLYGGDGIDELQGNEGNDTLDGGSGNDFLNGGDGNDIYIFQRGYGVDTIHVDASDGGSMDSVQFGPDVTLSDLEFSKKHNELRISIQNTEDVLVISNWFSGNEYRLVQLTFSDGTLLSPAQILESEIMQYGSSAHDIINGLETNEIQYGYNGNDTLNGNGGNDTLYGGPGSDYLYGGSGDDILDGGVGGDFRRYGTGADYMSGGSGNDTYRFGIASGTAIISNYASDNANTTDTVEFGECITVDGLELIKERDDVLININNTSAQLRISGWFDEYNNFEVDQFRFADGSILTASQFEALGLTVYGGNQSDICEGSDTNDHLLGYSGNDCLYGGAGDDVLDGSTGDDYLYGSAYGQWKFASDGNDTYLFGIGSGCDTIFNAAVTSTDTTDTVAFGDGITVADLELVRIDNALAITVRGTSDQLKIHGWFDDDMNKIDRFEFANGDTLTLAQLEAVGYRDNPTSNISGTEGSDILNGYDGNDTLWGCDGDDVMYGGAGNDTLYGDLCGEGSYTGYGGPLEFNDVLDGGPGNDYMAGGIGNDTYKFYIGSGRDVICDDPSIHNEITWIPTDVDTIELGAGITLDNLELAKDNDDLVLRIIGTTDELRIQNWWFDTFRNGSGLVERFCFADGSTLTADQLVVKGCNGYGSPGYDFLHGLDITDRLYGYDREDYLYGYGGRDVLCGGSGDDYLDGGDDDDVLDGGSGNDVLYGNGGNDTYKFGVGDGCDTVYDDAWDYASTTDVVEFGEGISAGHLELSKDGDDMVVCIRGTSDQLRINDWFINWSSGYRQGSRIELFTFADGSALTADQLQALGYKICGSPGDDVLISADTDSYLNGYSGDDHITGGDGNDVIDGGAGADIMLGGTGRDTYVFNLGDGNDTIIEITKEAVGGSHLLFSPSICAAAEAGIGNRILFGDGIGVNDVSFSIVGTTLTVAYGNQGDTVTIENFDPGEANGGAVIDYFEFSDGFGASYRELTNQAPVAGAPLEAQSVLQGQAFSYTLPEGAFVDPEGEELRYVATISGGGTEPAWLSFAPVTRTFSGTPANGDVGSVTVTVAAFDTFSGTASQSFTIEVINVNDAPVVAAPLADQLATEDQPFSFQVAAGTFTDVDAGDQLSYSATLANGDQLPAWLVFDAATGTFSGTPANPDVGVRGIKVTATDGSGVAAESAFSITVANVNDAPVVAVPLTDQSTTQDQAFSFQLPLNSFMDIDTGDQLTYGATLADDAPLPSWLSFDAATRTFSGTPDNFAVGALNVRVTASDLSGATACASFTLTVSESDPVMNGTSARDIILAPLRASHVNIHALAGNDIVSGSTGSDRLLGDDGNDMIHGGRGNDYVDGGNGNDILDGGNGTDLLRGGSGNDILYGGSGNDTLDGGAGSDTLMGGSGNDTYLFGRGQGNDTIVECDPFNGDADTAQFTAGVAADQLWFRRVGLDLEVSVIGTTDKLDIEGWYVGSPCHVDRFRTADGTVLLDSQVNALVGAMASFAAPPAGQTTLPDNYQTKLAPVIAANWH
jgi:Ca2+-binding RTX toxin-like protein